AEPDAIRTRLAEHPAAPVRFQEQVEAMYADGVRTFVEVGAGSALTGLIGQILGEREHLAVSLDRPGRDGVTAWHEALGRLAVWGLPMNLPVTAAPPRPAPPRMSVRINGTGYRDPNTALGEPTAMPEPTPEPNAQWLATVAE